MDGDVGSLCSGEAIVNVVDTQGLDRCRKLGCQGRRRVDVVVVNHGRESYRITIDFGVSWVRLDTSVVDRE